MDPQIVYLWRFANDNTPQTKVKNKQSCPKYMHEGHIADVFVAKTATRGVQEKNQRTCEGTWLGVIDKNRTMPSIWEGERLRRP